MRRVKKIIYGLLLCYVMIGGALYFLQENLFFSQPHWLKIIRLTLSFPFEELNLHAEDGAIINAIHFKLRTLRE